MGSRGRTSLLELRPYTGEVAFPFTEGIYVPDRSCRVLGEVVFDEAL